VFAKQCDPYIASNNTIKNKYNSLLSNN